LQPYYEGLRDRVMTWFDVKGLVKKPKLVAVTSCDRGAGVSSIAAGLAATFSETGDGRVLLVDMNVGQGAAHSFYKGKPGCGLDEAVQGEKLEDAQVNDNLFVVAEAASNTDKLPSVLPRRFTSLVPKLKATDFDYIIFDMPAISPVSMTPRLSAYMDMVLLVVEAEKTPPQKVKQATDLLGQSKANVAAVFNKTKGHGPKWLTNTLNG
jgi:Mrp family chromosome partitioning ATPase